MKPTEKKAGMLLSPAFACLLMTLTGFLLGSCAGNQSPHAFRDPDPARITALSPSMITSDAPIKVVFGAAEAASSQTPPPGLFRFYPPIDGQARWDDDRSLSFVPAKPLKPHQAYRAEVDLGLLSGAQAGGPDYFSFNFVSLPQSLSVHTLPPRIARDGSLSVEGSLELSEGGSGLASEKSLSPSFGTLSWSHESDRVHRFTVSNIPAANRDDLVLRWNGGSLGSSVKGSTRVKLPSASRFELLGARSLADDSGSRGIELAFSRALDRTQDLRGLVSVEGLRDLRYTVTGSAISLYSDAWPDKARVHVEKGLKDSEGRALMVPVSATVAFDWEKPLVRFLSKGNILPTTQGLVLPIETMNLAGVIVEAMRVYGDNMTQFLQVNDLDSYREMRRVGEVVWRKDIDLGWKDDWKNRWVRQGLDLSPLLAKYKDGMFQIRVTFRKNDIRYISPTNEDFSNLTFPEPKVLDKDDEEFSYWSYVEAWGGNSYETFQKYKDDPCHPAYYLPSDDHDITIKKNVLVSDIGASIAREADGTWHIAASDLRSAKPMPSVAVSLYSYQRQKVAGGSTDASGLCLLKSEGDPAFASLSSGTQTSWLKIDQGSTLAIGHFDIGGDKADSGLKGFIYGERGVWRPGDPIHLTFILYDRSGKLPSDYPVSYQLEDPMGRVVRTGTYTKSLNGFYSIESGTDADAPTGTYLATVTAGGLSFSKNLKIETIMPNRLKIDLAWPGSLPAGAAAGSLPSLSTDTQHMSLAASWLTGAKAGAFKADVSASFSAGNTGFSTLPEYSFSDPTRDPPQDRAILFNGRLGNDGKASFDLDIGQSVNMAPGKLKANILTRVFEPSGIFSSQSVSADFHPYSRYVGIHLPKGDAARGMLLVDKDQRVDLALVDRDGNFVKGGGKVEVAIYQLEWRWWWEKGEESLAQRADELFKNPIKKDVVAIGPDGRGSWTFQIKYPNWGRYLVRARDLSEGEDESSGHAAGSVVYIDWPDWAGRARDQGGAEAMLNLTAGAPKYSPGDRASVSFPSNETGEALVRVERAGKILREEWIPTKKDTTTYEFPVTPEMAPNVYVHVTFVQPHLQTANDLPIRLYGIIPLSVEDPATRIKPLLTVPATLAPGTEASFSVSEASGRAMTYSVAVVDEGLLGITNYRSPDPWDQFYQKEASDLSSWDLYQYVMGAYSGKLETLLAVGGSDDALAGGNRKPSRFPPVVYFFPPSELKAGEVARKTIKLGTYIGALRFMVIAGTMPSQTPSGSAGPSHGAAFGVTEVSAPVRADVMAQLTAPRVLSPGEEAQIPATVFGFMGKASAAVKLEATGSLSLIGYDGKTLAFAQDGDQTAVFRVKASTLPGQGRLRLVATMNGKSSEQSLDLEVRPVGLPVSVSSFGEVQPGQSWDSSVQLPGQAGSNSLSVEISRLKSIDLAQRIDYLIRYPNGCAEQTTSAAFPQLYLPKAVNLTDDKAAEARDNVSRAIIRLRSFQTPRGGFSMWPGEGEDNEWISAYVLHFLVSAKREGFEVPDGLIKPALDYLESVATAWNSTEAWSQATQAYRLYVLARAGQPDISSMNRLHDFPSLPVSARYRLAAAYALSGMRDIAIASVKDLSTEVSDYDGLEEYTYGSPTRERAVVLDALNAMGDTARALAVYDKLADELAADRWYSTQELGMALEAALPYAIQASNAGPQTVTVKTSDGSPLTLVLDKAMARLDLPKPAGEEASLSVSVDGGAPVAARIVALGVPAAGKEKPLANGLSLSQRYVGMDGKNLNLAAIGMGSDFIVETTVENKTNRQLSNLALMQLLPASWEIANFRLGEDLPQPKAKAGNDSSNDDSESDSEAIAPKAKPLFDYRDVRDDRVQTYFSLDPHEKKVFTVYVTKAYDGSFFLPATSAYAMYDEARFQALIPGRWLDASAPGRRGGNQQ